MTTVQLQLVTPESIDSLVAVAKEGLADIEAASAVRAAASAAQVAACMRAGAAIAQIHAVYRQLPQRWGQTWDSWCREQLGIGKRYADQLRAIASNLGGTDSQILPPATHQLTTLARLRQRDPAAFEQAVVDGRIHPDMSRRDAQALLKGTTTQAGTIAALTGTIDAAEGMAWKLGEHLLYCADSSTWRPPLDAPAALAFADPPYGLTSASWDESFYWNHDWLQDWADFVAVTPGIRNAHRWSAMTTMAYRWTLTYWEANGMTHGPLGFANVQHVWLYSRHESIHRGRSDFGKGAVDPSETRGHRGQKPLSLMVWLLELLTDEGDWVIDPFLGSGTTLLAAEKAGRKCIGVELNPDYCRMVIAAWEQQTGKQAEPIEVKAA